MSDDRRRQTALAPGEDERVRAALARIVREAGSQAEASRRLGYTQQQVSRVMRGIPAGRSFAERIAEHLGTTFAELVGRTAAARHRPVFSSLPGWEEAEAEARRRWRHVPAAAFDAVRGLSGAAVPTHVTPEWIAQLASVYAMALRGEGEDVDPD